MRDELKTRWEGKKYGRENYTRRRRGTVREWDILLKAGATILHADREERTVRVVPQHSGVVQ